MRVLLLNQCFHPDVVSTAQHLTDLAVALIERGHEVEVIAADRGYDDPRQRFPRRETIRGVRVTRVRVAGLGKARKWRRALDAASFFGGAAARLAVWPRVDAVVSLTSPPMIASLGAAFARARWARLGLWMMDLNPDEAIEAGWLAPRSASARVLHDMQRRACRRATAIVVLDRFMRERVVAKGVAAEAVSVIPPWAHDDEVRFDLEARLAFRARHGLTDKFVVMYSGNHSPCHPLDTVLEAARALAGEETIVFCFVGGGSEFGKVRAFAARHALENVKCLPYQPLSELSGSLSAADLHVVVMGDRFVGVVHPCKIYNILAIGAPFVYVGPSESHVGDIIAESEMNGRACGARHGDVDEVVGHILRAASRGAEGARAVGATRFSKQVLMPRLIEALGLT